MKLRIAVLPGDGIGPEVMAEALRVLETVAEGFGHQIEVTQGLVGGAAWEAHGCHMPEATIELCRSSDAILFGSVGGPVAEMNNPKWHNCERNSILSIRKEFSFAVNLRPVRVFPELAALSPLKQEIVQRGVDIVIVRELLGDCYFGHHERFERDGQRHALDHSEYSEEQIKTAARAAFKAAAGRSSCVTSVDKANVLTTSQLWREVVVEVAAEHPQIALSHMLVDNCAMQLMLNPAQFDVIVTSNMFGDILSDAAAALPGSLGLVASASLTADGFGLYEPPGGRAQDIAGKGSANPIAQILSAALMLRYSFSLEEEASCIESAVEQALARGLRTADIKQPAGSLPQESVPARVVTTREMTDGILQELKTKLPRLEATTK